MTSEPRLAFVIDSLPSIGGGEKVLFAALEAFHQADIFTLVYNQPIFVNTPLASRDIKTSILDSFPFVRTHHRYLFPLMPMAIESFALQNYDCIVCFHYAVAHGVKNYNGARHLSYTFTPMRYAWTDLNIDGKRSRRNKLLDYFLNRFRQWDRRAASRVHSFASISQAVSQRIRRAYNRDAPVIYPPVETERFKPNPTRESFYITISRLVPYKRMDLLVRAFNQLKPRLLIIGDGPELHRLKAMASDNIQFLGFQSDENVADLLGKARAFICAAEEDFGIAIVEAQAAGCPVIAYGAGGALETVIEGKTGLFFHEQSLPHLVEAVERFERTEASLYPGESVRNAARFGKARFIQEFVQFVNTSSK